MRIDKPVVKKSIDVEEDLILTCNVRVVGDVRCRDIKCKGGRWNIDAGDIDAWDIVCVSRRKKNPKAKTIACGIVLDRFNRERKEVMPEKEKQGG